MQLSPAYIGSSQPSTDTCVAVILVMAHFPAQMLPAHTRRNFMASVNDPPTVEREPGQIYLCKPGLLHRAFRIHTR
ncbi:hypothetical protein GQ600_22511 [Phytophthora cactorum]|nr:hypothetical protein GQ600_22511 [Phytophthora cactorum]